MAGVSSMALGDRIRQMRDGGMPKVSEGKPAPKPKRGDAIFAHAGGPQTWADYIGQKRAKGLLKAAVASAKFRKTQVDHILIASGVPGVGKSALARLVAHEFGGGLVETQGSVTQDEARAILAGMQDGDFWLVDEIHQLVVGGKSKAEWLLPLLQDGVLLTSSGEWQAPKVTIIGASTNTADLPEAILSRFIIRPVIESYSEDDATAIAEGMARSIFESEGLTSPTSTTCRAVSIAANNSPRDIRSMLSLLRDAEIAEMAQRDDDGNSDLETVLDWAGRTADGLDDLAQRYMATLLVTFGGKAGKDNLGNVLGESTYPVLTEQMLLQNGYIGIDRGGRWLTESGVQRTLALDL